MSRCVLILGESGSGKSTSIENLNPQETVLINVVGKDLPFRGWKSKYPTYDKATKQGNSWEVNDSLSIVTVLKHVSDNMPHVKTIIIDDFQYVMSYEFMKRAKEKGYEKFTEIAQNAFNVINTSKNLRSDLNVFYLSHIEQGVDTYGDRRIKIKTIGKMIDDKLTIEGLFTVVLLADAEKNDKGIVEHFFITRNDGTTTVKSPKGMFETDRIPNDLQFVINKIQDFEK